jgi:hypothetical protein
MLLSMREERDLILRSERASRRMLRMLLSMREERDLILRSERSERLEGCGAPRYEGLHY